MSVDSNVQVIGWDFVSHTKRYINARPCYYKFVFTLFLLHRNGTADQMTRISTNRNSFDLGAVMIRKSLLIQSEAKFLPSSVFTKDLSARDHHFFMSCISNLFEKCGAITFVRKILLLQQ